MCILFFPQLTYYQTNTNNDLRTYICEHALFPTLSWTSYYDLSNPLSLPLYNNQEDNECLTRLHHLTTALYEKHFTTIGPTQTSNRFTAQKANRHSINHYDHAIARYMEDTFLKLDHVITTALHDTKTYDPYFKKFNHFLLIFKFLTPKKRGLHCSHQMMLRTKQSHTYVYYKFIQHHYTTKTPSRNPATSISIY